MTKANFKEYIKATEANKNKKYEDYVAIKQLEHKELQEMADLMESPEIASKLNNYSDAQYGDELYDSMSESESAATTTSEEVGFPEDVIPPKPSGKFRKIAEDWIQGSPDLQGLKTFRSSSSPGEIPPTAPPDAASGAKRVIGVGYSEAIVEKKRIEKIHRLADAKIQSGTLIGAEDVCYTGKARYKPQLRRSSAQFLNPSIKVVEEYSDVMPEIDSETTENPVDIEMFNWVREGFKIVRTAERTLIYVVVKSNDPIKNTVGQIKCCGGIAFGGYARDAANDTFLVECVEYIDLGSVPFGLRLEMPNCGTWDIEIPIPEKVLDKALAPLQRKVLSNLRKKYPTETYEIFYLQLVLSN